MSISAKSCTSLSPFMTQTSYRVVSLSCFTAMAKIGTFTFCVVCAMFANVNKVSQAQVGGYCSPYLCYDVIELYNLLPPRDTALFFLVGPQKFDRIACGVRWSCDKFYRVYTWIYDGRCIHFIIPFRYLVKVLYAYIWSETVILNSPSNINITLSRSKSKKCDQNERPFTKFGMHGNASRLVRDLMTTVSYSGSTKKSAKLPSKEVSNFIRS